MTISIISAIAENRVIGNKNKLPWHLPADFKWFKDRTSGKTIILGLNTFKSIGEKPLPNRKHIILSKDSIENLPESCFWANSIEEALKIAKEVSPENSDPSNSSGQKQEVFVCGGAMVYKQFLPLADKLYLTYIHHNFKGDTFFPEFSMSDWREVSREDHEPDDPPSPEASDGRGKNKYSYSFVVLERKNKV